MCKTFPFACTAGPTASPKLSCVEGLWADVATAFTTATVAAAVAATAAVAASAGDDGDDG